MIMGEAISMARQYIVYFNNNHSATLFTHCQTSYTLSGLSFWTCLGKKVFLTKLAIIDLSR